jgi:hypothetical protein
LDIQGVWLEKKMTAEKSLVYLLRGLGGAGLLAAAAVVMPFEWMATIHGWLGLGEMPAGPVVGYLARSLSAFYVFHGVIVLGIASDVRRYLPLARLLGWVFVGFGLAAIGIDWFVGLPWYWVLGEGPVIVPLGAALVCLAGRVGRQDP